MKQQYKSEYYKSVIDIIMKNETYLNIVRKWITGDITINAISKLSDILVCNLYYGIDPPQELSYLSYEWNVTSALYNF